MLTWIDNFLNKITMYRLVFYYLCVLLVAAFVLCLVGILPYDPAALAFSFAVILGVSWTANRLLAWAFDAAANVESVYITAFILALIIPPVAATDPAGVGFLIFASVWAMASKFLLAPGKRHIFNPAAFGVALSALVIGHSATWWVGGNLPLLPFVLIGGLLIVRKVQRFDLVLAFTAAAAVSILGLGGSGTALTSIQETLLHSSFFFFAFVMLTEPLTTPPTRSLRIAYGAIVGLLFGPNVHFGNFYLSPELALLVGNVFSWAVSPKGRYMLTLVGTEEVAKDAYEFSFAPDRPFSFAPGQYMEWTLSHKYADDRGNRRYFTVASSPTERDVRLGVKFYAPASTFKRALAAMKPGDRISAAHISGGFTLPRNPDKKLVFIAGGIGITPFRSMVRYLVDRGEHRDVVILYSNRTKDDIAYRALLDDAAARIGIRTVYAVTADAPGAAPETDPNVYHGPIDASFIARAIPDFKDRTFYISGPHAMVDAFGRTLRGMGVSRLRIKSDFFPGFA